MCTCGKSQIFHRHFQQLGRLFIYFAMIPYLPRVHLSVRVNITINKPSKLFLSSINNPISYFATTFTYKIKLWLNCLIEDAAINIDVNILSFAHNSESGIYAQW